MRVVFLFDFVLNNLRQPALRPRMDRSSQESSFLRRAESMPRGVPLADGACMCRRCSQSARPECVFTRLVKYLPLRQDTVHYGRTNRKCNAAPAWPRCMMLSCTTRQCCPCPIGQMYFGSNCGDYQPANRPATAMDGTKIGMPGQKPTNRHGWSKWCTAGSRPGTTTAGRKWPSHREWSQM